MAEKMLGELIRAYYADMAAKRGTRGNITGSSAGSCTAALQQRMYRDKTQPITMQPRSMMVFAMGDAIEEWFATSINKAAPGQFGLRQQRFYAPFPLPEMLSTGENVDPKAFELAFLDKIEERLPDNSRRFWGSIDRTDAEIQRPRARVEGGRLKLSGMRMAGVDKDDFRGLIYQPKTRTLWVPTNVDGIQFNGDGLAVVEAKSMSNWDFWRSMVGNMSYAYRLQLYISLKATGAGSATWLLARKETMHIAQVVFAAGSGEEKTQVVLVAPNGSKEVNWVVNAREMMITNKDGKARAVDKLRNDEWDSAQVWTPFSNTQAMDRAIAEKVVRLVMYNYGDPLFREYGPDFRCPRCQGQGMVFCKRCSGSGINNGKACGYCGPKAKRGVGKPGAQLCAKTKKSGCDGAGVFEEVDLPFPCSYCQVVSHCWGPAEVRLEITDRPRWKIARALYEKASLGFIPPEPIDQAPVPDDDDDDS